MKGKLSENARLACSDQVNRGLRRSALLGIPAAMLLALILGSSVPAPRRVIFVLLVSVGDIVTFFGAHRYLSRRKHGVAAICRV